MDFPSLTARDLALNPILILSSFAQSALSISENAPPPSDNDTVSKSLVSDSEFLFLFPKYPATDRLVAIFFRLPYLMRLINIFVVFSPT